MSDKKFKWVNGPLNLIRLEGKIGSVKKVVRIFLYEDINVNFQKKCDDVRSLDISTYLIRLFDAENKLNPKKTLDFFVQATQYINPQFIRPEQKGSYLQQVMYLLYSSMNYDDKTNKMKKSIVVPNVRFHDLDQESIWRNTIQVLRSAISYINDIVSHRNYDLRDINYLHMVIFNTIGNDMVSLSDILYGPRFSSTGKPSDPVKNGGPQKSNKKGGQPKTELPDFRKSSVRQNISNVLPTRFSDVHSGGDETEPTTNPDSDFEKAHNEHVKRIINKLMNVYENESVKKTINQLIQTEFRKEIDSYFFFENNIMKFFEEEAKYLQMLGSHSMYDVLQSHADGTYSYGPDIDDINKKLLEFEQIKMNLLDLFFHKIGLYLSNLMSLRRLLDKNYVTDAVIYMDSFHGVSLIRLLVKSFNFEITNWTYLKNNDVKQSMKILKESTDYFQVQPLFMPPLLSQCIDIEPFPATF